LWFSRAERYAAARDLSGWPRIVYPDKAPSEAHHQAEASDASEAHVQAGDQHKATGEMHEQATSSSQSANRAPAPEQHIDTEPPIERCAIWVRNVVRPAERNAHILWTQVGSTDDKPCRLDHPTADDILARDGIALAYFPLIGDETFPNPAETWSTWRCARLFASLKRV
jgi:hypothetical protein